jgi:hypothetical protein
MVKRENAMDRRRTPPENHRPYSPKQIDELYKKDREPGLNHADGDGLSTNAQHAYEVRMQQPQPAGDHNIDGHQPGYDNDTPSTGRRAWLRGMGPKHAEGKPAFDSVGIPGPAKGGGKCEATGKNMKSSPFSRAHFTYSED